MATLLLAAEVLEEMQAAGELEVAEAAGTSAGSIAAFAVASAFSIKDVRNAFVTHGEPMIKQFNKKPSLWRLILAILMRRSMYSERAMKKFFRSVFPGTGKDRLRLSSATIPVHVRTADLLAGLPHTYRRQDRSYVDKALADSCAIPFALRAHSSEIHYVDGGLVSNLVDPTVFDEVNPIIAFSFEKSEQDDPNDLKSYLGALASTVIDSNVQESVEKITAAGGEVCLLPNHFSTFEFEEALNTGFSDDYVKNNKHEIREKIRASLSNLKRRKRLLSPGGNFASGVMEALIRDRPVVVTKNVMTCIAWSFESADKYDQVIKNVAVAPQKDSIFAFKLGISRREAYELGNDIEWEISDNLGSKVEALHEVLQTVQNDEPVWHSCFVLKCPLPASRSPIHVKLTTSHRGLLSDLDKAEGRDWMRSESGQNDLIEEQLFVFYSPKKSGSFVMVDLLLNHHRTITKPNHEEAMKLNWSPGEAMTTEQLKENMSLHIPEYNAIGWRVPKMKPGSFAGTLIERGSGLYTVNK